MATTPNGRRAEPPMTARQVALIIKHLESIDRRLKAGNATSKSQGERIIKCLQVIVQQSQRRAA